MTLKFTEKLTCASERRAERQSQTPFAAVAALAVGTSAWICRDAWKDMWDLGWNDEESSHVLLAPLIAAWLIWSYVSRSKGSLVGNGSWVGTGLVAAGWIVWAYGYRQQVHTLWHLGALIMALGAFTSVAGSGLLRHCLPGVFVLLFLIPVAGERRQQLARPMQLATASISEWTCASMGMDVVRQGSVITVKGVDVAVAEACNGMRMVITLIMVSYLYAFITPLRWYVRALILLLSPFTAILCNVVRLVPTVWVFGHAAHETAERFHTASGWIMLFVGFLLLTGLVKVMRWAMIPVDKQPATWPPSPSGITPVGVAA
jgi:exosortase